MYLKSIEIQGFKSFAHKIKFDFHNGITGIVGPNGSGKSNVADAVRWVLGEQRIKQLRGGTMQDVIFAGTENRKPLSYASVAITLDNADHQLATDYSEVTVTRKLYRSGESEYLLNGTGCRLKDINELFYDTGIGKEGYSIIGQGQIDRILSGKPEERRDLFDEAAGIVKFKRRKALSVRKLEDEQSNLIRVNDILTELERQVIPLEKQAEKAKAYLEKKDQLKNYDINMFLLETERIQDRLKEVEENLKITDEQLAAVKKEYDDSKAEHQDMEDEIDQIDAQVETGKHQLNETTLLKQQLENQIELIKEQIHSAKSNDEHYESRLAAIDEEIQKRENQESQIQKDLAGIQNQLEEKNRKEEAANRELAEVQTKLASLTEIQERSQTEIMDLLNARASTTAKIQHYDTMLEQINVRRSELNQRGIKARGQAEETKKQLESYQQEYQRIVDEIEEREKKVLALEEQINTLQKDISTENSKLQEKQRTYHQEASRLQSLKNITERYEGYGNSIRRVMEKKKSETGLLGVVADIIKVDKDYELAIETALGGNIQNIVTDNEETAKKMISYLKKNRFGRATFLPLTAIRNSYGIKDEKVLQESGVIGLADGLVKTERKYESLASSLLGRTVVVDTIDHAIAVAKKYRQSIRLVTKEGDLINPGGAMSGGAFKNSSNLLSRRREMEDLENMVTQAKKVLDELEKGVDEKRRNRTDAYEQLEQIRRELQKAYVVQNTAKINVEQAKEEIKTSVSAISGMGDEEEELNRQIDEINDNQNSIQLDLEMSQKLEQELNEKINIAGSEYEQIGKEQAEKVKAVEQVHLSYASLGQKHDFLLENEARIKEEIKEFQEELTKLSADRGDTSRDISDKEVEIAEIKRTIENSKDIFEEIGKAIKEGEAKKEELTKKNKKFLDRRDELSRQMAELDKELFRLNSRKESYEEASESQINYMWEEYEITYNRARELRDTRLTDLSMMKRQIQTLKNEIRGLGDVNVNAIEEFKELNERYEFLKTQHDDLVQAEATLQNIIAELDNAMRRQFQEQFARIADEFDHVFKELFGGGKGTLELMGEEDILEAGIQVIAQPPGKKLQNMMQLSGGEKALTAISLLFAIQNLKPSPFCLLDEIEAALDDSNVIRFAEYLHKLTENTQFIVITHRRGTMTAADRLYGITMQEKGVSALVSVNLVEDQLDQ